MNQLLIGLHGLARTGKDTAAAYLAAHYALLSYAFADPLKAAIVQLFDLSTAHIEGDLKEQRLPVIGKSPRQLMQLLGTEWGRNMVHDKLWLLLAQQNIANQLECDQSRYSGVVIRDVRFENEAQWIRSQGGYVVHILRPDAQQVATHSSESRLRVHDQDAVIYNERSIDELHSELRSLMIYLQRRQAGRPSAQNSIQSPDEPAPTAATQLAPCRICGGEALGYDYARPLSPEFIHGVTCRYKHCQKTEGHASQDAATKAWNALQSLAETAPAEATAEPASQSLSAADESTLRYICRHGGTRQLSDAALVTVHLAGTYHALLSAGGTTEHLTAATDGLLYAVLGGRLDQLLAA